MTDLILPGATVLLGDCIARMKELPRKSVQTCVTSPPYYGLRDYGVEGQLGLEETPEEYIACMVAVFREVREVLADDGTLWVNIGDSYSRNPSKGGSGPGGKNKAYSGSYTSEQAARLNSTDYLVEGRGRASTSLTDGIKHKDLIGIPWMLAFALRADGWYLRQDIIWHKPNPMPESVTDRCTKSHEYMFLLSKSKSYFYDHVAVKEPATWTRENNPDWQHARAETNAKKHSTNRNGKSAGFSNWSPDQGRNRRSVWTIATRPYKGAHFAVFPPALVEPCILAGSRPGDIVLDPFNGSGTTGAVAIQLGRRYLGTELNENYLELTRHRLEAAIAAHAAPEVVKIKRKTRPAPSSQQADMFVA